MSSRLVLNRYYCSSITWSADDLNLHSHLHLRPVPQVLWFQAASVMGRSTVDLFRCSRVLWRAFRASAATSTSSPAFTGKSAEDDNNGAERRLCTVLFAHLLCLRCVLQFRISPTGIVIGTLSSEIGRSVVKFGCRLLRYNFLLDLLSLYRNLYNAYLTIGD